MGDAVSTGRQDQFLHFLALLQKTLPNVPVFVAAGNHELTNRDMSEKGLDNSCDALTLNQIDYLKRQLNTDNRLKFVFMPIPPQTQKWIDSHAFTMGANAFLQTLSGQNVAGAFYGHYHLYDEDTFSGTRQLNPRRRRRPTCPFVFLGSFLSLCRCYAVGREDLN